MSSSDAALARRRRGVASGFTLIEVLAAVALLGILYAVLARVAIEGLRAEGDSARRLEASLLADERLTDLFGAVSAPPIGRSETIEGDYTILVDVVPFSLPQEWVGVVPAAPLLLAPAPTGDGLAALRTVQVTILWLEGATECHVSRTLFMFDFAIASQLMATAANAAQQSGLGEPPPPPTPDETPENPPEVPEAPEEP